MDYPLVTVCLLEAGGAPQLAVSGACAYPVGPEELQGPLDGGTAEPRRGARAVAEHLRERMREDFRASGEYRAFLLEELVLEALESVAGGRRKR